jgi:hypothetical protein
LCPVGTASPPSSGLGEAGQLGALREIERRVLWLSTAIIHEAN